jgi:hypothetical protein
MYMTYDAWRELWSYKVEGAVLRRRTVLSISSLHTYINEH